MVVRLLSKPRLKNAFDKKQAKKQYEREKRTRPENYQAKVTKQRAAKKAARKFVAIDSEGVSFGEKIEMENGDLAQKQRTIFWGAASEDSEPDWLDGNPYCTSIEIIEWRLHIRLVRLFLRRDANFLRIAIRKSLGAPAWKKLQRPEHERQISLRTLRFMARLCFVIYQTKMS
jgi:hypothetical protein